MGGATGWSTPQDLGDWMRHQEKRVMHEERRPRVAKAADIMGPGLAPQAVEIADWNGVETEFNGLYYTRPAALHSPDATKWWIGTSIAQPGGYGVQQVIDYRTDVSPPLTMVRTFKLVGDTRLFSAWSVDSGGGGSGDADALAAHIAATQNVHGIPDTSNLAPDDMPSMTLIFENGLV